MILKALILFLQIYDYFGKICIPNTKQFYFTWSDLLRYAVLNTCVAFKAFTFWFIVHRLERAITSWWQLQLIGWIKKYFETRLFLCFFGSWSTTEMGRGVVMEMSCFSSIQCNCWTSFPKKFRCYNSQWQLLSAVN